jgi:hypothetical protein
MEKDKEQILHITVPIPLICIVFFDNAISNETGTIAFSVIV